MLQFNSLKFTFRLLTLVFIATTVMTIIATIIQSFMINSINFNIAMLELDPQTISSLFILGLFTGISLFIVISQYITYVKNKRMIQLYFVIYTLCVFLVISKLSVFHQLIMPTNMANLLAQYDKLIYVAISVLWLWMSLHIFSPIQPLVSKLSIALSTMLIALTVIDHVYAILNSYVLIIILFSYTALITVKLSKINEKPSQLYFISSLCLFLNVYVFWKYPLEHDVLIFLTLCQLLFLIFAINTRTYKTKKNRLNHYVYHQNGLIREVNLEIITQQLLDKNNDVTVVMLQPENIKKIRDYAQSYEYNDLMLALAQALEEQLKDNLGIATITPEKYKIAFIEPGLFAFVINNTLSIVDLDTLLNEIQNTIKNAYKIKQLTLALSANIGLTKVSDYINHKNNNALLLINDAKKAMYNAVEVSQPHLFYCDKNQQTPLHLNMAASIETAIANDELEIYHQPQVDLKTLRVCGSECLIRWYYQGDGFVSPRQFIPIAEDIGVIPQLTRWVINKSLEQHLILIENGHKHHSLSINISAKDIIEPSFVEFVQSTLKRYDISPDKLVFEVSESTIITDNSIAISTIEALIALGITMSIDHFGSGYSSMAYISQLPCQELKVDRQFVENITLNPKNRIITETTVKMAKGLSLEVIAEGINSKLDETILRDLGCDIGQGYYYAKAMPLEHYLIWLEKQINGRLADDDFL